MKLFIRVRENVCLAAFVAFGMAACQQSAADTRAADAQAIRETYAGCLKAAQAKDLPTVVSCFADDAVFLFANAPMRMGKEEIRQAYANWFANPGYALNPTVIKLEVSSSGDLAYDLGNFSITLDDPNNRAVTKAGKFVHIWRKLPDGSWKLIVAISNPDQPPTH